MSAVAKVAKLAELMNESYSLVLSLRENLQTSDGVLVEKFNRFEEKLQQSLDCQKESLKIHVYSVPFHIEIQERTFVATLSSCIHEILENMKWAETFIRPFYELTVAKCKWKTVVIGDNYLFCPLEGEYCAVAKLENKKL